MLSPSEIKSHYKECKHNHNKMVLLKMILTSILSGIVLFGILCLYAPGDNSANISYMAALYLIFILLVMLKSLRRYKGSNKLKHNQTYSYEKEAQLKRLHAYSSHNKSLIDTSQKCYCFYCKTVMDSREIKKYTDDGQTAICPECGMDSIIPDSIGETIDETVISEMNDYWF